MWDNLNNCNSLNLIRVKLELKKVENDIYEKNSK